jgi:hypothetical protein
MVDLVPTQNALIRRAAADAVPAKGDGPNLKIITAYRNPGALTVGSTIRLGRFDSNTRLHTLSTLKFSANAASTTLAVGLASVNNNFGALQPTALLAATSIATAGTAQLGSLANAGRMLWEIAGLASDPGGQFDIYATTGGATLNASSDVVAEFAISLD